MLQIKDLHVSYGGIRALKGVSLDVKQGELVTIIGANGAGKSTLLNAISGFLKFGQGEILYKGRKLERRPDLVVKSGICH
ncbi:MAG: ATP-binding cassette domain-containing protein, partial [Rectinemataceae bacterium]